MRFFVLSHVYRLNNIFWLKVAVVCIPIKSISWHSKGTIRQDFIQYSPFITKSPTISATALTHFLIPWWLRHSFPDPPPIGRSLADWALIGWYWRQVQQPRCGPHSHVHYAQFGWFYRGITSAVSRRAVPRGPIVGAPGCPLPPKLTHQYWFCFS